MVIEDSTDLRPPLLPCGRYLRVLIDEARTVVDFVVNDEVQILLGGVLADIRVGELLLLGHDGQCGVSVGGVEVEVEEKWSELQWQESGAGVEIERGRWWLSLSGVERWCNNARASIGDRGFSAHEWAVRDRVSFL